MILNNPYIYKESEWSWYIDNESNKIWYIEDEEEKVWYKENEPERVWSEDKEDGMIWFRDFKSESMWYKEKKSDFVWWKYIEDAYGEFVFSFDTKVEYNLFAEYPYKLTLEQKEIFDRENPYWTEFFKDRH